MSQFYSIPQSNLVNFLRRRLDFVIEETDNYMRMNSYIIDKMSSNEWVSVYFNVLMDELHPHFSETFGENWDYKTVQEMLKTSLSEHAKKIYSELTQNQITENLNQDLVKFRRRIQEFEEFLKESDIYRNPCEYANSPQEFIAELTKDITYELEDTNVPEEFIDVVKKYISKLFTPSLIRHYKSKCKDFVSENKNNVEDLIKKVGSRYKSDPWIRSTKILDVETKKDSEGGLYYYIYPKFIINDLEGNFPHIEKHLLGDFIESMIGVPIHSHSARIEYYHEGE